MSRHPQPCMIAASLLRPCSAEDLPGKYVVRLPNGETTFLAADQFAPVSSLTALGAVFAERLRQISDEGWSPGHDDEHDEGELAAAAAAYAFHAYTMTAGPRYMQRDPRGFWPWTSGWKPGAPRRDLVKAAALILAEIERLDRTEAARGAAA